MCSHIERVQLFTYVFRLYLQASDKIFLECVIEKGLTIISFVGKYNVCCEAGWMLDSVGIGHLEILPIVLHPIPRRQTLSRS